MENFLRNTKEEGSIFLFCYPTIILFSSAFNDEISSQIENKLILSEVRMSWKLQKWSDSLGIIENHGSIRYEIQFLNFLTIRNYYFTGLENSTIHVNNQIVLESNFGVYEKVTELSFESFKERFRYLVL